VVSADSDHRLLSLQPFGLLRSVGAINPVRAAHHMKSEGFHNQLLVDIERFSTNRGIPGVREPGRLHGVRTGSGSDRIRKSRSALGFLLIRSLPLPVLTQNEDNQAAAAPLSRTPFSRCFS
jgi:hypothetical protein